MLFNKNYNFTVGISIISDLQFIVFMVKLIPYVTVNIMGKCSSILHDQWGPAYCITMKNFLL